MALSNDTARSRDKWSQRLYQMRGAGSRRARRGEPSASLRPLLEHLEDNAIILDVGCGESGDYQVARQNGLRSFRVDLFAPSTSEFFVRADALSLPFVNGSIDGIVNHAVLSLIAPFDRWKFYEEAARVLKPNGLLSVTPYDLADGFAVKLIIEDGRAADLGLHKVGRGLYQKCANANCDDHPDLDPLEAMERGVNAIDTDPMFRHVALILLAWFSHGWSIENTVRFTGRSRLEVKKVIEGLIACGIYDPKKGCMEAPWMDHFMKDEVREGNVALILDVLCINGTIIRSHNEDGEVTYCAASEKPNESTAETRYPRRVSAA